MPIDILEAGCPALRLVHNRPPFGDLFEARPERMLSFVVDQDMVGGVLVLERIGHVLLLRVFRVFRRLSSIARALPIFAAGRGSIMASCTQSTRWMLIWPVT